MRIRNVIIGVALTLTTICFTPVTANATVSPTGAAAADAAARAAAPLPVPKTRTYITLVHPQITTMVADCPSGHSCFYDGANFTNRFFVAPSPGFFDFGHFSPPKNDKLTSIVNTGAGDIDLYNWGGFWDYKGTIEPGNWGNLPSNLNNIIDAVNVLEAN